MLILYLIFKVNKNNITNNARNLRKNKSCLFTAHKIVCYENAAPKIKCNFILTILIQSATQLLICVCVNASELLKPMAEKLDHFYWEYKALQFPMIALYQLHLGL